MTSRRGVWLFSFVFLALLINGPTAHGAWTRHRIAEDGVTTYAEVVTAEGVPEDDPTLYFVTFTFPREIDQEQREFSVEVDEATYHYAKTSQQIQVRYLADNPGANVVAGQVERKFALVLVVLADIALLAFLVLYLRFGRREGPLRLLATSDIERTRPGFALDQVSADEWVVTGEIVKIADDVVTMVSQGGRQVQVTLGEHENRVGYQQPAQVRGRTLPG